MRVRKIMPGSLRSFEARLRSGFYDDLALVAKDLGFVLDVSARRIDPVLTASQDAEHLRREVDSWMRAHNPDYRDVGVVLDGQAEPLIPDEAADPDRQSDFRDSDSGSAERAARLSKDQSQDISNSRRQKVPLPATSVDFGDKIALKRARNTLAARESRQRKLDHVAELEKRNADLEAELDSARQPDFGDSESGSKSIPKDHGMPPSRDENGSTTSEGDEQPSEDDQDDSDRGRTTIGWDQLPDQTSVPYEHMAPHPPASPRTSSPLPEPADALGYDFYAAGEAASRRRASAERDNTSGEHTLPDTQIQSDVTRGELDQVERLAEYTKVAITGCDHRFRLLKSESTNVQWNCSVCYSGPNWVSFKCLECTLELCRACWGKLERNAVAARSSIESDGVRKGEGSTLLDVLARFKHTESTDARDKVYALLGLASDTHRVEADYTKSVVDFTVSQVESGTQESARSVLGVSGSDPDQPDTSTAPRDSNAADPTPHQQPSLSHPNEIGYSWTCCRCQGVNADTNPTCVNSYCGHRLGGCAQCMVHVSSEPGRSQAEMVPVARSTVEGGERVRLWICCQCGNDNNEVDAVCAKGECGHRLGSCLRCEVLEL
jgi:hypothetical protein